MALSELLNTSSKGWSDGHQDHRDFQPISELRVWEQTTTKQKGVRYVLIEYPDYMDGNGYVISQGPMFSQSKVLIGFYVPGILGSQGPLLLGFYVSMVQFTQGSLFPGSYVLKGLCSKGSSVPKIPFFKMSCVPRALCSLGPLLLASYIQRVLSS